MGEAGKGGFGFDEARADDEAGGVVDGEGEDLELLARPPLVRGAIVLEEIAVAFALPSAAGLGTAFERFTEQFGHVLVNMASDVGGGAFEGESSEILSARKLKLAGSPVARVRRRKASASSGQRVE